MTRKFLLSTIISLIYSASLAQKTHVILITIDGFRPEFYIDPTWNTPNMRQLMDSGIYAKSAKGIFPTVTYPSHTTIVTGRYPAYHGIMYNAPFEPVSASGKWNWYADSIKVPTLWQAAHKAGLTTAAVLWPVTVGADIDYNIPEIWALTKDADRVQPMKQNTTPAGLWEEIEQNATGKLQHDDLNAEYLRFDENIARMAAYLIVAKRPNLLAVHFANVDEYEHKYGREHVEVRKAVAAVDHCIGQLVEAIERSGLKDSTTIIITGDHGFSTIVNKGLFPNAILANAGLIQKRDGKIVDWKAKFQATGGSAFLYLKDKRDTGTLSVVKRLLANQPDSVKMLFRVIDRKELKMMGVDSNAMLAIATVDGIFTGGNDIGPILRNGISQLGAHGFSPENPNMNTGFIIEGNKIKGATSIEQIELVDLAGLISQILLLDYNCLKSPIIGRILY